MSGPLDPSDVACILLTLIVVAGAVVMSFVLREGLVEAIKKWCDRKEKDL